MYSSEYEQKYKLLKDTIQFKETDTVAHISNIFQWMIFDSGYDAKAFYDWKIMKKALVTHLGRYQFDGYQMNTATHCIPLTDAFGGGTYWVNKETGAWNVVDHTYIEPHEYAEYAEDPNAFMKKVFARKYKNLTTEMFANGVNEFLKFGQYSAGVNDIFNKQFNRPLMFSLANTCMSPLEMLSGGLRGLKDLALDLRRNKEELKIFIQGNHDKIEVPSIKNVVEGDQRAYVANFYTAMLAHASLSIKQFDELYWPYLKEIIDAAVASNKILYVFAESEILRLADFFKDIPRGNVVIHIENDDIYEMRKKLPDMCLAGGFPSEYLRTYTPDKCVDKAKELIQNMKGGYIMGQSKIASYPKDIKRENLTALCDYMNSQN